MPLNSTMPDSVSRQLFTAIDDLTFIEDATIQGIQIHYSARNETRDRQVHRLLENALISDKIPKNILESAYRHFKSLLKGFLIRKSDGEVTGVRKFPSLTRAERETILKVASKTALIAMQAMITTIGNDGGSETNDEIEVLTRILGLSDTHPVLMKALFEDAYRDAVLELVRGETREQVHQVFLLDSPRLKAVST